MFPLSVIILTRDEARNIEACLARLTWVDEVILVDSFSSDDTLARAKSARPDIRIFHNKFEDFGQQRNWALDNTNIRNPWILFVDADERIDDACAAEIRRAVSDPREYVGFFLCYRNIFLGRWIKHCTHFPSWQLRLLKHGSVRFRKEGHGQREVTEGKTGYIQAPFDHLDLSKGISQWVAKHDRYANNEIELLSRLRAEPMRWRELLGTPIERRRCLKRLAAKLGSSPALWFVYVYFIRRGFLDGWAGLTFCRLRLAQQIQVRRKLIKGQSANSAIQFHDRIAHRWEEKYRRKSFISRAKALEECLKGRDLRGQKWLDAGCGSGRLTRYLSARGCSIVGVDGSAEMIGVANQGSKSDGQDLAQFKHVASIESMNVESESLDGVLCLSVLEYLDDPQAALQKLSGALRPGGALVISVPNRRSIVRRGLSVTHKLSRSLGRTGWPAYLQFSRNEYSAQGFAQDLEAKGLRIEKQAYLGGPLPQSLQASPLFGPLMMFVARKAA